MADFPSHSGLLPLHIQRNRYVIDAFARLDHVLRCVRIFLEMRRFQMSLECVCIMVNFKQSDACWIILFEYRTEASTSGLDTNGSFPVLFNRGFELFQLGRINFEFDHKEELSLYRIRSRPLVWQGEQQRCTKD